MSSNTQTEARSEIIPAVDIRSIQEIMQQAKPGERFRVTQVMSSQGVVVFGDEAHIVPFETPRGDLAFQCIYPDGDRLTITGVDSYLWKMDNEQ